MIPAQEAKSILKFITHIFLLFFLTFLACKKKEELPPIPPSVIPSPNYLPDCKSLPPPPQPFGWKDSSKVDDKNVNAFRYNPLNAGEMLYIVNGDAFQQNKIYLYNYSANQRVYLGNCGSFLPSINTSNGWMVFNKPDNNIYKVKLNGDSLTQLTNNFLCSDPKWDQSKQFIYCYQAASGPADSYLLKLSPQGQVVSSSTTEYPNTLPTKTNDKLYYLKTMNTKLAVYLKNTVTNTETLVLSSNKTTSAGQNDFFNLAVDGKEEYLYWTNETGVLRCNLANSAVDTLLKNCPNYTFLNPIVSENSEELTVCCRIYTQLNSITLLREYKCFEMNLITKEWRELNFFPN